MKFRLYDWAYKAKIMISLVVINWIAILFCSPSDGNLRLGCFLSGALLVMEGAAIVFDVYQKRALYRILDEDQRKLMQFAGEFKL